MSLGIKQSAENKQRVRLLRGQASQALQRGNPAKAHYLLALAKSLRTPLEYVDYLRALTFLKQGKDADAREALKEELRYFPSNDEARSLLQKMSKGDNLSEDSAVELEFRQLCATILPYTMVGLPRLRALYEHAVEVCRLGPQGNFVECGVAAGGSSALLSAVLKAHDPRRRLFSCDSFSGMPPTTSEDIRYDGVIAQETGWGEGTCASPESSVLELCEQLETRDLIITVKGFFEDTLPVQAETFTPIAFLHMDGDWYASTKIILETLYERLVPGAYVQVDDFGYWSGCRKAFCEFFQSRSVSLNIENIDGCGIWFYKPDAA